MTFVAFAMALATSSTAAVLACPKAHATAKDKTFLIPVASAAAMVQAARVALKSLLAILIRPPSLRASVSTNHVLVALMNTPATMTQRQPSTISQAVNLAIVQDAPISVPATTIQPSPWMTAVVCLLTNASMLGELVEFSSVVAKTFLREIAIATATSLTPSACVVAPAWPTPTAMVFAMTQKFRVARTAQRATTMPWPRKTTGLAISALANSQAPNTR